MKLNIDQLLADAKSEKILKIILKSDDLPLDGEQIIFCHYPKLKKFERLFRKYYGFRFFASEEEGEKDIEGTTKDNALGFAIAIISSDAYDWEGFDGEFNAKKLEQFFEEFPKIAKAFSEGYVNAVEEIQKERLEKFLVDEKNSEPM